MSGVGKILFALCLIVLMLFKASAFHVYEHHDGHDEHEECHLCDIAMENQVVELHFSPQVIFPENTSPIVPNAIARNHSETFTERSHKFGHFSRPPPPTF